MTLLILGVWIWGILLAASLIAVTVGLVRGIHNREDALYRVIRQNNTVIAGGTAVLGVIWSWFIQLADKPHCPWSWP